MALIVSSTLDTSSFVIICVAITCIILARLCLVGRRPSGLPPGPQTLPLIGNLHLMPTWKPFKAFAQWGAVYGPIYSLMLGSSPLIIIQSQEVAKELLDKRGANYSSRPNLYIMSELASRGLRQVAMVGHDIFIH